MPFSVCKIALPLLKPVALYKKKNWGGRASGVLRVLCGQLQNLCDPVTFSFKVKIDTN